MAFLPSLIHELDSCVLFLPRPDSLVLQAIIDITDQVMTLSLNTGKYV